MKRKIGYEVLIKKDLREGQYGVQTVVDSMLRYVGIQTIITSLVMGDRGYRIECDDGNFCWTDEMFEL